MRHDEDLIIVDFHCAKAMAKIPDYKDDFFEGTLGGCPIQVENLESLECGAQHSTTQHKDSIAWYRVLISKRCVYIYTHI